MDSREPLGLTGISWAGTAIADGCREIAVRSYDRRRTLEGRALQQCLVSVRTGVLIPNTTRPRAGQHPSVRGTAGGR